jgi:hypothetical protein
MPSIFKTFIFSPLSLACKLDMKRLFYIFFKNNFFTQTVVDSTKKNLIPQISTKSFFHFLFWSFFYITQHNWCLVFCWHSFLRNNFLHLTWKLQACWWIIIPWAFLQHLHSLEKIPTNAKKILSFRKNVREQNIYIIPL